MFYWYVNGTYKPGHRRSPNSDAQAAHSIAAGQTTDGLFEIVNW